MTLLQQWYDAWVAHDVEVVSNLIHPDVYGHRFYVRTICLNQDAILAHLNKHTTQHIELGDIEQERDSLHYTMVVTDDTGHHDVIAKAIFKEGKLYKLYETVQSDKTRYKVRCAYDGSVFLGYQRQPIEPTVQGTLESAITDVLHLEEPISIHASGRTDKGVHAHEQVFHFDAKTNVPTEKLAQLIQTRLPDAIHIHDVTPVRPTFHSRYDVSSKEYVYKLNLQQFDPIQRNYEWFVSGLDLNKLEQDAQLFVGTHDFAAFTATTEKNTIRTIHNITLNQQGDYLYIHVKGNGFLRYMVRYMVYALVAINLGKLHVSITDLLYHKDNTHLGQMAPAGGLYLHRVMYE